MKKFLHKKNIFSIFAVLTFALIFNVNSSLNAEEATQGKVVPAVNLKDLTGKTLSAKDFENGGKPIVISFWATWCKPCLEELNAMAELYEDWQATTGVKIVAVSIDDSRTTRKVAPLVKSKGWDFEVYLDENSDFKRAMGVSNPPHTFLLDGNRNIVYEHNGYASGDEVHLLEEIKKASSK